MSSSSLAREESGTVAPPAAFLGDPEDPWARDVAAALPAAARKVAWPGTTELPESPPDLASAWVIHRSSLTATGSDRLARWRREHPEMGPVIVCHGPHVRGVDLQRWSSCCDALLPDVTAPDVLGRYLGSPREREIPGGPPRVAAVSAGFDLRSALVASCRSLGYPADPIRDWSRLGRQPIALWDVPVLEPGWPEALADAARRCAVVALLGLPDRESVAAARRAGAAACLSLPYDEGELGFVLDRLSLAMAARAARR